MARARFVPPNAGRPAESGRILEPIPGAGLEGGALGEAISDAALGLVGSFVPGATALSVPSILGSVSKLLGIGQPAFPSTLGAVIQTLRGLKEGPALKEKARSEPLTARQIIGRKMDPLTAQATFLGVPPGALRGGTGPGQAPFWFDAADAALKSGRDIVVGGSTRLHRQSGSRPLHVSPMQAAVSDNPEIRDAARKWAEETAGMLFPDVRSALAARDSFQDGGLSGCARIDDLRAAGTAGGGCYAGLG